MKDISTVAPNQWVVFSEVRAKKSMFGEKAAATVCFG